MIHYQNGDIFKSDVEAIVNPVNCVGIMGKGLALQFKNMFPENFKAYKKACDNKHVVIGKMFMFYNGKRNNPKFIINFPTKRHWKENSQLQDIKIGLNDLLHNLNYYNIKSIAMPALGCGLGNLDWKTVRSIIEETFKNIPNDVKVYVYRPKQ